MAGLRGLDFFMSTSRAILFRKLTIWRYVSTVINCMRGESRTYRSGKPAIATPFEPAQVATERGGTHDDIRILFDLDIWHGFIDSDLVYGQQKQFSLSSLLCIPDHLQHEQPSTVS